MAHTARSQYRNSQLCSKTSASESTPNLIMSSNAPRVLWFTTASCREQSYMPKPERPADLPPTTDPPRPRLRQRCDRHWEVVCWPHAVEAFTFSAGLSSLLRGGTVATDQLTRDQLRPRISQGKNGPALFISTLHVAEHTPPPPREPRNLLRGRTIQAGPRMKQRKAARQCYAEVQHRPYCVLVLSRVL